MIIGHRIEERRRALGIRSQAALARLASVPQTTLNGLVKHPAKMSPHLTAIARALRTSVEYLVGETDSPDAQATFPSTRGPVSHVLIPTTLLSETALTQMIERFLETIDFDTPPSQIARGLAHMLSSTLCALDGKAT